MRYVLLGVGLLVLAGCSPESKALLTGDAEDVTVRVTGTDGIAFSGSLGSGGNQRSVEGTIPATFTIEGKDSSGIIIAVVSNKGDSGVVNVELENCPDGEVHESNTSAAYGIVTVSC
jgi:hypothetical protein